MPTIGRFAARQFGLITTRQLHRCGLDSKAIRRMTGSGWLTRVYRGVYSVGAAPRDRTARLAAGILACGEGSALSHRSAAEHLRMLPALDGPIDVLIVGSNRRSRPGITIHRSSIPAEIVKVRSLPVTSVTRTLLDLAATESFEVLGSALNAARRERIVAERDLRTAASRGANLPGVVSLRRLLEIETGGFDRSRAEKRLRELIRAAGLPTPCRNFRRHGHELDYFWPELSLSLEMDGYRWHSTRDRFDSDRRRDAQLAAVGVQVIRISYEQLDQPERLVAQLAAAIAHASGRALST